MKFVLFGVVVVGLILVAVPVWIAFWSALGFAVPWLFFIVLAWVFLAAGRHSREPSWSRRRWQYRSRYAPPAPSAPAWAPRPARPTSPPAEPVPARSPSQLPIDAQAKVDRIRAKAEVLVGYAARFPSYSKDLYLVRQTTADYLPRTIQAFLAVPPGRREVVMVSTGKTPLQELNEQLDLLDAKLNEIAERAEIRDLDRLLANRRFLEERFGPVIRA